MKPPAGVISTQPTMIAVAAPIAVTVRPRIRSSVNQVISAAAGQSSVFVNASTLFWPVPKPLPPLKPNQPNHSRPGAQQHVDGVVRQQRLAPVVLARPHHKRSRQRREARGHLDGDAAGEVQRAAVEQPAGAEGPVREHRVHEHRPQRGEDQERAEAHPLHHRARDQRDRDDAEGPLEGEEQQVRNGRALARLEA